MKVSVDFRPNYLMNSHIQGIEDADLLLLVGTNPQQEAPVLNARILKATNRNKLKVFLVGTANELNYNYVHLGNTAKVLEDIASGNHPFASRLKKAKLPMVLAGASVFEREDGDALYNTLKKIASTTPIISKENFWNGFNILHKNSSKVGALDIGINPVKPEQLKKAKVIILLGADNDLKQSDIPEDAFVVYIGSQGDEGAYYADVVLPAASYLEKNGTYVNTEGRVQLTRLSVTSPAQSRDDWMILRAISEECGITLP